ncbi:MAG: DUF692 domain-containing protein [Alphaproteobacteria bacterium]|nr:DUF692 domain-containing protein [Alphaproteobacteria bacterium]
MADPIPARAGVGLKPEHYRDILDNRPDIGWFEVHAENYMEDGGPPHRYLSEIRERYPLSVHGVGLSIGGAGSLDLEHLARLKRVCDRYEPGLVSEHLAWSSHDGCYFNDLLPLPYTTETLARVCEHVDIVQSTLKRQILIENPSTYVDFAGAQMREIDFLGELAKRTGCGLLLDVNNVFVQATNHGFRAADYIDEFPLHLVQEIHLAGHAHDTDDDAAPLLIDAHGAPVADPVWSLFVQAIEKGGARPALIEWDNDIPDWERLHAEARRAEDFMKQGERSRGQAA